MATKKKVATKQSAPRGWLEDDDTYPRKREVCDFCGQRDDLKLSFDRVHWICINDHACVLRWKKIRADG